MGKRKVSKPKKKKKKSIKRKIKDILVELEALLGLDKGTLS